MPSLSDASARIYRFASARLCKARMRIVKVIGRQPEISSGSLGLRETLGFPQILNVLSVGRTDHFLLGLLYRFQQRM